MTWKHWIAVLVLLGPFSTGVGLAGAAPDHSPHYLKQALLDGTRVQRWNDETRTIYVRFEAGEQFAGWRPQMSGLVKAAFGEWEQALGGKLHFVYTSDPDVTDIVVGWRQQPVGVQVGHQNIQWTQQLLTEAALTLSLQNPQGGILSDDELKYIALHEIGHVLGIRGHSNNPNDVMFATLQPQVHQLSARDIATVRALYREKPDITNPVGIHLAQFQACDTWVRAGVRASQEKAYGQAFDAFQKAYAIYPQHPRITYFLGISAYNLKNFAMALQYLEPVATGDGPDKTSAMFYVANALTALGSQEILAGKESEGKLRLQRARSLYASVKQSPDATEEQRTTAMSRIEAVESQFR